MRRMITTARSGNGPKEPGPGRGQFVVQSRPHRTRIGSQLHSAKPAGAVHGPAQALDQRRERCIKILTAKGQFPRPLRQDPDEAVAETVRHLDLGQIPAQVIVCAVRDDGDVRRRGLQREIAGEHAERRLGVERVAHNGRERVMLAVHHPEDTRQLALGGEEALVVDPRIQRLAGLRMGRLGGIADRMNQAFPRTQA
jgi:hypothetical protein